MTQFINFREALATEAIDGVLCCAGGRLARLDGYPHIKVVVRRDWDKSRVASMSGSDSGASPVMSVLAGILAVSGGRHVY